ncbi:DNA-directed RNA polymerase subunit alpha [Patescibacteria group bacterium]|nr:DNA-directed RNA polymerase subunit alpha [Patescibacteria group bacterium]
MPRFEPQIKAKKETSTEAELIIGPFEPGMGHTVGNALRRVLLSYLPGAAVTELRIENILHEFSTIEGIKEDVIEIILNIRKVNFKMDLPKPLIVTLDIEGITQAKAGNLHCPANIEVINKDLVIANLTTKKSTLKMELKVEFGRGYHLSDEQKAKVGVILFDADFSPIKRVSYKVEPARVGRVSDLDQVHFEIVTDGTTTPRDALYQAAAELNEHFNILKQETAVKRVWEEIKEEKRMPAQRKLKPIYLEEFNLPTRLLNALKEGGVQTIEDINNLGSEGIKKIKNVGPKSVTLINRVIEERQKEKEEKEQEKEE